MGAERLFECLSSPLCELVNTFIEEGGFPNHLKQAYVIPIYKKGDCEDPNNYRPISITAALAKISEKVLREQMLNYLESNKLVKTLEKSWTIMKAQQWFLLIFPKLSTPYLMKSYFKNV